jgi:hypothetical protein
MKNIILKIPQSLPPGGYIEFDLSDSVLEIGYDKEIRVADFIELLAELIEKQEKSKD